MDYMFIIRGGYMKITFLGATKTVTGSNFLVEGAGKKFLVDCRNVSGASGRRTRKFCPISI